MADSYILFIKALFIGLTTGIIISIPIGPAGIESVRWTITKGFRRGILVAMGSVMVDVLDAVLINFGLLSWIESNKLMEALFWMVSGIVTFFIGLRAVRSGKSYDLNEEEKLLEKKGITAHPVFTGFIITLTYPMTHFSWLTFSTTFIRYWRNLGVIPYVTFVSSMLAGILTGLTGINYLASKGRKVIKVRETGKFTNLLAHGIALLGVGFFIFGLIKLYLHFQ
ncbi:LysE family transporter [Clostridium thermarum]|uniref:LysE family transporter n=1 Tax=Clostridium thermarum TaxID=1716543 RepID=UPI0013D2AE6D|nr:LysE family transporter [Clostridium thermarum]